MTAYYSSLTTTAHCKRLVSSIKAFDIPVPKPLLDTLDAWQRMKSFAAPSDAVANEIKDKIVRGELTDAQLATLAAKGAAEQAARDYVASITGHETLYVRRFHDALDAGIADEIIDALRPKVDQAMAGVAAAKEHINGDESLEAFLNHADAEALDAWQSLPGYIATLDRAENILNDFLPGSSFPLFESSPATLRMSAFAVFFTDPSLGKLMEASQFSRTGRNGDRRDNPWYRVMTSINLNTLAEAREYHRAYLEQDYEAVNQTFRGTVTEDNGIVQDAPMPNPYRKPEPAES